MKAIWRCMHFPLESYLMTVGLICNSNTVQVNRDEVLCLSGGTQQGTGYIFGEQTWNSFNPQLPQCTKGFSFQLGYNQPPFYHYPWKLLINLNQSRGTQVHSWEIKIKVNTIIALLLWWIFGERRSQVLLTILRSCCPDREGYFWSQK